MELGACSSSRYIGWDVGGWNCDHNPKSKDAIVILDMDLKLMGKPWRGNLRETINSARSTGDWLRFLFKLCGADVPEGNFPCTIGIDTPLGFSEEFVALITQGKAVDEIGDSSSNAYLYRKTERYLFDKGLAPLSSIKDMIGSQSTKGMHVLSKFAPTIESCGEWTDGKGFKAIEAYPSACKKSKIIKSLLGRVKMGWGTHADVNDALVCALVAYLFDNQINELNPAPASVPLGEGWIWVPKDIIPKVN